MIQWLAVHGSYAGFFSGMTADYRSISWFLRESAVFFVILSEF